MKRNSPKQELTIKEIYNAKSGEEGMKKLKEVAKKAKAGKMTNRQAASTLGITYFEFVSLLKEIDAADA